MYRRRLDLKEVFLSNIVIGDNCWQWQGRKDKDGYGSLASGKRGIKLRAHRFAYELWHESPGKSWVLHSCDNPSCVNPKHLFLGDALANIADRNAKGRQAKGVMAGNSKLNEESVRKINELYRQGHSVKQLASMFGVTLRAIVCILKGITWKYLRLPAVTMRAMGRPKGSKDMYQRIAPKRKKQ